MTTEKDKTRELESPREDVEGGKVNMVKDGRRQYYVLIIRTNIEKMGDESLRNYPTEEELEKATLFNNKESKTSQTK